MTSSLVGSEMCIRDRSSGHRSPSRSSSRHRSTSGASSGRRRTSSAKPVSYTHLTLPTICSV
eukprot:1413160-Prorocentrum_lima.AAC.1